MNFPVAQPLHIAQKFSGSSSSSSAHTDLAIGLQIHTAKIAQGDVLPLPRRAVAVAC